MNPTLPGPARTSVSPVYQPCPACASVQIVFKLMRDLGGLEAKCGDCGHAYAVKGSQR